MRVPQIAYSLQEAARQLGISRVSFYRLRKLGKIPVCKDSGYCGVLHSDIVEYLESIRGKEGSDAPQS